MSTSNNDNVLKDAQYRKSLSIAFFNATNAAIEMCKGMNIHEKETLAKIIELRDFFLEEHKNYHASVIAKIGAPYKAEVAVELLNASQNLEHLKNIWQSLSEDERRDPLVIKAKDVMKKKHEEA